MYTSKASRRECGFPSWLSRICLVLALGLSLFPAPYFLTGDSSTGTLWAQETSQVPVEAAEAAAAEAADAPQEPQRSWIVERIDEAAEAIVGPMSKILFFDPIRAVISGEEADRRGYPAVPLVVLWLIFGALFMTFAMKFINFRAFRHSLDVVRGRYSSPDDKGEVSHFQALSAALSATVGLGNIAGVAVAVQTGGPGAVFWMIAAGFFGMTSKFVECTLGQKYRQIDSSGRVSGGAMHYLERGLREMGLGPLGKTLGVFFAVLCVGGSFGGGNMFQVNQSYEAIANAAGFAQDSFLGQHGSAIYGVVAAVLVGLVIIGGIRRIASTASSIVPGMCVLYVVVSAAILLANVAQIPAAFGTILMEAFSPAAIKGGFLGVLIIGVQRAAFSNEAGIGSAAIAHAAAKTDEPVREGIVALLEPFIDTILICTMTGLVVVVTGAHEFAAEGAGNKGVAITSHAWASLSPWLPAVLAFATVLFAFSTMISWSYYGERCWEYLFGERSTLAYKVIFLLFVFIGAVSRLGSVLDFSDMMILGMAFPNLIGCLLLSGKVRRDLAKYWAKYCAGEFKRYS